MMMDLNNKYSQFSHRHDWTLSKWHVYIYYDSDTSVINNYITIN